MTLWLFRKVSGVETWVAFEKLQNVPERKIQKKLWSVRNCQIIFKIFNFFPHPVLEIMVHVKPSLLLDKIRTFLFLSLWRVPSAFCWRHPGFASYIRYSFILGSGGSGVVSWARNWRNLRCQHEHHTLSVSEPLALPCRFPLRRMLCANLQAEQDCRLICAHPWIWCENYP